MDRHPDAVGLLAGLARDGTRRHDIGRELGRDDVDVYPDTAALFDLIAPSARVERLCGGFHFTEGPTWSVAEQALYFSDIPSSRRIRWADAAWTVVVDGTNKANGMTFDRDGMLVVCEHTTNAVARFAGDGRSGRAVMCDSYRGRQLNSPNDLAVRSADGSVYFTDPLIGRSTDWIGVARPGELAWQGVYRVAAEGGDPELLVDRDEFVSPNGLCFSPDEAFLYVNDSRRRAIKRFPVSDDGRLGPATELAEGIGSELGSISCVDGMECDEFGNIWVTSPGGVWVFDIELRRLGIVRTREDCGSLVWGGPDLRDLYLTTRTSLCRVRTTCRGAALAHHSPSGHVPVDGGAEK